MYTLIKTLPMRRTLAEQVPAILFSLTVAELYYKFGSFLYEALAFLATWFVADMVIQLFIGKKACHE